MTITELIKEQSIQAAVMFASGIAVMIMYQIFRNTCKVIGAGKIAGSISEIVFWATAAVMTWQFLYYCAYGRLSFHAAMAFTAGALLWRKYFYAIIDKIYTAVFMKQGKHKKNGEKEKKQPVQRHQSGDRY